MLENKLDEKKKNQRSLTSATIETRINCCGVRTNYANKTDSILQRELIISIIPRIIAPDRSAAT